MPVESFLAKESCKSVKKVKILATRAWATSSPIIVEPLPALMFIPRSSAASDWPNGWTLNSEAPAVRSSSNRPLPSLTRPTPKSPPLTPASDAACSIVAINSLTVAAPSMLTWKLRPSCNWISKSFSRGWS